MKPFEKTLRLLLNLHALMEAGKGDGEEANKIREEMDVPYGWGGPRGDADLLTEAEIDLLDGVSAALQR